MGEGDTGPNTGGMGAYAPARVLTPALLCQCEEIVRVRPSYPFKTSDLHLIFNFVLFGYQKSIRGMALEGASYKGVLYTGFMITSRGPYVLEYNARFGDPETQVMRYLYIIKIISQN